jgi:maltose alpha-D-glucosyltransferase/alpha-amylase
MRRVADDHRGIIDSIDESALREFLLAQRWFAGKARPIAAVRMVEAIAVADAAWLTLVDVRFGDGVMERYAVPLAVAIEGEAAGIRRERPAAVLARVPGDATVYDALFHDGFCLRLLALARGQSELPTPHGRLVGVPVAAMTHDPVEAIHPIARSAPDQSNTSVLFGRTMMMKLFRRLEEGRNPDVELSGFLTRSGFAHTPALIGTVELVGEQAVSASLLMVQRYLPNQGNGWAVTLAILQDYLAAPGDARSADQAPRAETMAPDLRIATLLGRRTAELHVRLAAAEEPSIAAEACTTDDLRSLADAMRTRGQQQLRLLEASVSRLTDGIREQADQVLALAEELLGRFDVLRQLDHGGQRIRCHGDFHLGQVLVTADDLYIIDFEGEPARTLEERRAKTSAAKDVAGMMRSFSYVAASARRAAADRVGSAALDDRAAAWERAAHAAFLQTYLRTIAASSILPSGDRDIEILLRAFIVDKALYELGYELNNRPDWVDIPLTGLLNVVGTARLPLK